MAKRSSFKPGCGYSKADWDEVSDFPELSAKELASAKPFGEVFPDLAAMRRSRGKQVAPTKERITLRIDRAALDAFRATGDGWQTRISDTLKRAATRLKKTG